MKVKKIINELKEIRKCASFEGLSIGTDTEYIKEKTKLYRETWIIGFLDSIIKEMELKKELKE